MICKKCGSKNVTVQTVSVNKGRGCLTTLLWIFCALTIVGLILLLIPIIKKPKDKVKSYAVCQNCGYTWEL